MLGPLRAVAARIGGFVPTGDVGERTVKSGVWVASTNVTDRVLKLGMLMLLARLLGPSEIGLFGIALFAMSALRNVSQLGIKTALVQQEDDDVDPYLDTAFTLQALRGAAIAAVLYLLGPPLATVFGEPRAGPLIQVMGVAPLLRGFRNPGVVYFQKDLEFHRNFLYRVSGTVGTVAVAVAYGLVFQSAWALVFGYVAGAAVTVVVTYVLHPFRPRPRLEREVARDLIGYGKWITLATLTSFLYSEGDDGVVGWLLSAASLGFYQMAYRLSNAPATEITMMVSSVLFPAYSKLQGDIGAVREAFFRTLRLTSFITFPISVGIFAVAPSFVRTFLGPDWLAMIPVMQLLVIYGAFRSLSASFAPVWKATGRPDLLAKLRSVRVVLLAVTIIPVTNAYGIVGTAALITWFSVFPMLPLGIALMTRTLDTSARRFARELVFPVAASAAMGAVVLSVREAVDLMAPLEFALLVPLGVVAYAGAVGVLVALFDWQVTRNLRSVARVLLS